MALRKLGTVGDINPIEHGGGYILGGVVGDGPWIEYVDALDVGNDFDFDRSNPKHLAKTVTVYRVGIEKCGEALMSDLDWVDVDKVSQSCGYGDDPWGNLKTAQQRAAFVVDVAGYYGWHELDQYPLTLTVAELLERWKAY